MEWMDDNLILEQQHLGPQELGLKYKVGNIFVSCFSITKVHTLNQLPTQNRQKCWLDQCLLVL